MRIVNVMAVSVDGRIALSPEESDRDRLVHGFTNTADQTHLKTEIQNCDAVIVGANTVRASQKLLVPKNQRSPTYAILTTQGFPNDSYIWKNHPEVEKLLVSPASLKLPPDRTNTRNLVYRNQDPAEFIVAHLQKLGLTKIVLLGGGNINQIFYRKNLVTELSLTLSPFILARTSAPHLVKPNLPTPVQLKLISCKSVENHVFLRYEVFS